MWSNAPRSVAPDWRPVSMLSRLSGEPMIHCGRKRSVDPLVQATAMNLKPNYLRAFFKIFAVVFLLIAVISGLLPWLAGERKEVGDIVGVAALGGVLMGLAVTVIFTPRELAWDEKIFHIKTLFPGSGNFEWEKLEAWSPYGRGVFLVKFEDTQAFQVSPAGFRSKDWKAFRMFLQTHFLDKKTSFWIGPIPVRSKKK